MDENCLYTTVTRGISPGCPLSPVMAALYLEPLDRRMEATGLAYARFMDDWVILAPTRWSLRRAVRTLHQQGSQIPETAIFCGHVDTWTREICPIVDQKVGRWYWSLNPMMDRSPSRLFSAIHKKIENGSQFCLFRAGWASISH